MMRKITALMAFLLVCAPCGEIQEKFLDKSTISTGLPKCLAFYPKTSDSKTLKIQEFFLDASGKSGRYSWILRMDYYRS